MIRQRTCCFTGHRPEKLKRSEQEIKAKLEKAVDDAVEGGIDTFITGLARGVDLWAGEIVLERKKCNGQLRLIAAKPFESFSVDSREYDDVIRNANEVYIISNSIEDKELDSAYVDRDRWMVDNSSLVIAVYDGAEGGTRSTIEYADKNNIKVIYL